MPTDMSFISLSPHMHLIGRTYKIWYETAEGDSFPLIDIPNWDFHWQMYYMFPYIQKIPAGARIYSEALYDNTPNNPYNPNNPPITVKQGPYTTDEMLMTFMSFTEYQPGDEDILLDSSIIATGQEVIKITKGEMNVYPNPAGNHVWLTATLSGNVATLRIMNAIGTVVKQLPEINISNGQLRKEIDLSEFQNGLYFVEIVSGNQHFSASVIKTD